MRKISKRFEEICAKAEKRNEKEPGRFYRLFDQSKRYQTMGVYDSVTKKFVLFDTINLVGNFRYPGMNVPPEFDEMEALVS